ncbi:transporter substrate-binding domain-containing protein [Pelomonas sp. SE-A7]|uniref:substrate-binding periplasmic protein n=1 Tax=Pelomonas sp. SE-A7 TaxID=3054953 RepID=UPI00259CADE6|nr:transporter substrate-binding domain-containing protein [Pelomonas sp. SE-A7]MDM4766200.1 transporter substrate-binding domain-containing protein [Pelomonas sp. SE-A7]
MRRRNALSAIALAPHWVGAQPGLMRSSTLLEQDPATTVAERVMREAYRRLGLELQVQAMPGERSLISANSGETDAELYRRAGIDRLYPQLLQVPVPLLTYEIVVFTKSRPFAIEGWESLRPYRLGYVKGIKIVEEMTAGMKQEPVATMQQAFVKLDLGRTDLVLANRASGLAALHGLPINGVRVLSPPLATFPVFHYLNKRHEALLPRLTATLREMERERFIRQVQEEELARYAEAVTR